MSLKSLPFFVITLVPLLRADRAAIDVSDFKTPCVLLVPLKQLFFKRNLLHGGDHGFGFRFGTEGNQLVIFIQYLKISKKTS